MERENRVDSGEGDNAGSPRSLVATWSASRPSARLAGVASGAATERMSSPTTHPLLDILAAMVREALEYERQQGREAA